MKILGWGYWWYNYITRLGWSNWRDSQWILRAVGSTILGCILTLNCIFSIIFLRITPLRHKPRLEPDQAQARPGPQPRVRLGFFKPEPAKAQPKPGLAHHYGLRSHIQRQSRWPDWWSGIDEVALANNRLVQCLICNWCNLKVSAENFTGKHDRQRYWYTVYRWNWNIATSGVILTVLVCGWPYKHDNQPFHNQGWQDYQPWGPSQISAWSSWLHCMWHVW